MRQIIIYILFLLIINITAKQFPYQAFCHLPVADLFTFIPSNKFMRQPWDVKNTSPLYPRASQLLFNEQVMVIEERHNYSHVKISHWFYIPADKNSKITDYWMPSNALTPVTSLETKSNSHLPKPISYKNPQLYYENVVTLLYPYTHNGITYSAGTRFVKTHQKSKKETTQVKIYDPKKKTFTLANIPSVYLQSEKITSAESKRSLFLSLLESWTGSDREIFPYVLGGASITGSHPKNETITMQTIKVDNKDKTFYYRPLYNNTLPMGIDCSHLITRAAHIAQIPIFARNTTTFITIHTPITRDYRLQNGDFIVWRGHCCIIADIEQNLVIEARGYASGYGKIQKIQLKELFKNIRTYRELLKKYHRHEPLLRIDKEKKVIQQIDTFTIIPLIA